MSGYDLRDGTLKNEFLVMADFKGADLRKADLSLAELRRANLQGADLSGADLTGADLTGVRGFSRSQLQNAKIDQQTKLP